MHEPGKLAGYEFEASLIRSEFQVSQGNVVRLCFEGKRKEFEHFVREQGKQPPCSQERDAPRVYGRRDTNDLCRHNLLPFILPYQGKHFILQLLKLSEIH